jgi:hypothetical protein
MATKSGSKDSPDTTDTPATTCIEGDGGAVYGDSPIITEPVRQAGDPPSLVSPPGAEPIDLPDEVNPTAQTSDKTSSS